MIFFFLSHPYTRHSLTTLWLATMTFKCKLQTGWTILSGEQHVLHAGLQGVHTEQESTRVASLDSFVTSQTITHLFLLVAFVDQARGHPPLEFPSLYFSEIAFVL